MTDQQKPATPAAESMDGASLDIAAINRAQLKALFPAAFTETRNDKGELVESVDFEKLKAELGTFTDLFESRRERYGMDWPGKKDALKLIQTPTYATLKPARDESVNFDTTENLFIEGDNLEVLKLLQKSYYGKVKMIYIDPPYNTGSDFIYPDNFTESLDTYLAYAGLANADGKRFSTNAATEGRFHSKWLGMMYPRIYLARNLLSDDGVLCVSISDHESKNLKVILDEILGEENFVNCVSVLAKVNAGASGGGEDKKLKKNIEYLYIYAKNLESLNTLSHLYTSRPLLDVIREMTEAGESWKYTSILLAADERQHLGATTDGEGNAIQIFKRANVKRTTIKKAMAEEKISEADAYSKYFSQIFSDTNAQTSIRARVIDFVGSLGDGEMLEVEYVPRSGKDKGVKVVHSYISNTVRRVIWLSDVAEKSASGVVKKERTGTLWDRIDYNNVGREGGVPFPNGKKPVELLLRCFELLKTQDFIALDFFCGSGTLGHTVLEANKRDSGRRQYICVQLPEPLDKSLDEHEAPIEFCDKHGLRKTLSALSIQRLKNVHQEYQSMGTDTGFRVFKLDRSSFRKWQQLGAAVSQDELERQIALHIEHIDGATKPEDLLFELLIKSGFTPSEKVAVQKLAGIDVYSVADGGLLICLADKITRDLIDAVAAAEPLQFVCLDSAFAGNDQLKANAVQTFAARNQGRDKTSQIVFRTV